MKYLLLVGLISCSYLSVSASDSAQIITSAQCSMCKNKVEKRLRKIKGIESVELNMDSKILHIIFDEKSIDLSKIEKLINQIGYDANDKPAIPSAYKRLPACCRKGSQANH